MDLCLDTRPAGLGIWLKVHSQVALYAATTLTMNFLFSKTVSIHELSADFCALLDTADALKLSLASRNLKIVWSNYARIVARCPESFTDLPPAVQVNIVIALDFQSASRLFNRIWTDRGGAMYADHVDGTYATPDAIDFLERLCMEHLSFARQLINTVALETAVDMVAALSLMEESSRMQRQLLLKMNRDRMICVLNDLYGYVDVENGEPPPLRPFSSKRFLKKLCANGPSAVAHLLNTLSTGPASHIASQIASIIERKGGEYHGVTEADLGPPR